MKSEARVVGFDDAPHNRGDPNVPVVGVVTRGASYVEAVLRTTVEGDGEGATQQIAACVEGYRGRDNLACVFLQNLMVAGFNVVDIDALAHRLDLPVVSVARGRPDLPAVRKALVEGTIPGGPAKWALIEKAVPKMDFRADPPVTLTSAGCTQEEAVEFARLATLRGHMPECLRLAHLIGAGWVLGQSKGS